MPGMRIRVMIVDDHRIFREGLRSLLSQSADIEVVSEAGSGYEAIAAAEQIPCDVIIMDICMPDMNGIEATRQLLTRGTNLRVLALSMESDRRFVVEALGAGASGYVLKDCAFAELSMAIRTVFDGGTYLGAPIADLIIKDYLQQVRSGAGSLQKVLTPRETELLQLIAGGRNSKEMARQIGVSIKTIEVQRHSIMKKLDLYSVAALTKYAVREGLSSLG